MGRTQQAKTKYLPYEDMRNCTFLVLNYLIERGGLPLSEISRITSLDPDEIARRYPKGLYVDDRAPAKGKRGRKPINPEGPMTEAEKFRRNWLIRRAKNPRKEEADYDGFANALRLYDEGADVKGLVGKDNPYMRALYKIVAMPRSARSLERSDDIDSRRLSALARGNYCILEKLDDRSATWYKPTEKGKEFLYALMPAMRQAIEGKVGEELAEYL